MEAVLRGSLHFPPQQQDGISDSALSQPAGWPNFKAHRLNLKWDALLQYLTNVTQEGLARECLWLHSALQERQGGEGRTLFVWVGKHRALITPREQEKCSTWLFHREEGQLVFVQLGIIIKQPELLNAGNVRQILKQFTLRTRQMRTNLRNKHKMPVAEIISARNVFSCYHITLHMYPADCLPKKSVWQQLFIFI